MWVCTLTDCSLCCAMLCRSVPAPAAAVPAAPAPKTELDLLADGMYQQPGQQQQLQVDSFGEQPAFGAPEGNMTGMPPPGGWLDESAHGLWALPLGVCSGCVGDPEAAVGWCEGYGRAIQS